MNKGVAQSVIKDSTLFSFSESCITVGGPASGLPCIFPFKFNGITHNNCTMNKAHLTNNKVRLFWEGHKKLEKIFHLRFDTTQ